MYKCRLILRNVSSHRIKPVRDCEMNRFPVRIIIYISIFIIYGQVTTRRSINIYHVDVCFLAAIKSVRYNYNSLSTFELDEITERNSANSSGVTAERLSVELIEEDRKKIEWMTGRDSTIEPYYDFFHYCLIYAASSPVPTEY